MFFLREEGLCFLFFFMREDIQNFKNKTQKKITKMKKMNIFKNQKTKTY